jgi:hypothetical protein
LCAGNLFASNFVGHFQTPAFIVLRIARINMNQRAVSPKENSPDGKPSGRCCRIGIFRAGHARAVQKSPARGDARLTNEATGEICPNHYFVYFLDNVFPKTEHNEFRQFVKTQRVLSFHQRVLFQRQRELP